MNKIILCADDFGQNKPTSLGIIELLKHKRLSAVSCMTTHSDWDKHAALLKAYREQIDIGLHFNLTELNLTDTNPASEPFPNNKNKSISLSKLIMHTFLGKIKQKTIEAVFNAQLDGFIAQTQELPDFIDGHQHVHHLPVIRDAILAIYENRLLKKRPYIRISGNPFFSTLVNIKTFPKSQIIMLTGALSLKKKCRQLGIPHNTSFSGIYNFAQAKNYRKQFQSFLAAIQGKRFQGKKLIMCHPGLNSASQLDPLQQSRPYEYHYFMSDAFLSDCRRHHITLARF